MKKRNYKAVVGLFLAGTLTLNGCSLLPEEGEEKKAPIVATQEPYEFEMDIVQRETIYDTVLLYPKYVEVGGEKLMFGETGTVGKIYYEVGDEVKAGDVIAELNYVSGLRDQLEQLEEKVENDQTAYDEKLQQKDFDLRELEAKRKYGQLTKAQYNEAVEDLNEKYSSSLQNYEDSLYLNRMKLEQIREEIQGGCIVAGIDGNINSFSNLEEGRWVNAGRVVAQIVDASSCVFEVSTEYAEHFTLGDTVVLNTSSNDMSFDTVVDKIEGNVVQFKPVQSDLVIAVNTQARFVLELDRRENVLTLATGCVRYADGVPYVYYINNDGVRSMKTISVGMRGSLEGSNAKTRIEITDGLELGDIVIKK